MAYGDPAEKWENEARELRSEVIQYKDIIRKLYAVVVRSAVVLKYLVRGLALAGAWFFLSKLDTYLLGTFIVVTGLIQLFIDKMRKVVNPNAKLSEWNVL